MHRNFHFSVYFSVLVYLLRWKPPDQQEVFFNYSYTNFVFNFQFEKSLIKYIIIIKKKIIITSDTGKSKL